MLSTICPSHTDKNKEYKVILTAKGWSCTCPSFVFSKHIPRTCKHIYYAYTKLKERLKQS